MTASTRPDPAAVLGKLADGSLDGAWTLDSSRSSVTLKTASMWGLMKITARFNDLTGTATVTDGVVGNARIAVGAASIDTKNAKRDKHLRSADFLDSDNHPEIVFTLNSLAPTAPVVSAHGNLTVGTVTKPISVEVSPGLEADDSITLTTSLDVDRRDYGLSWNQLGMSSMHNAMTITAVFTR